MGIHTPNYHYDQLNDIQKEIDEQNLLSFNSHNIEENIPFADLYSDIGLNDHIDQYNYLINNDDNNQNSNKSNNDLLQNIEIIIDKNEEFNDNNNTKEISNKNRKNSSKNKKSKKFNNSNNVIGKKRFSPSKSKRKHDKYSSDNIIRKINCHFQNFIIFLVNEIIKQQNIKAGNCSEYFRNINGEEKKKIRKNNVDEIKNYRISKILTFQNYSKFRDKTHNEKLFDKIKNKDNEILQKVLNMTYIDVFKNYFYSNEKNIIIVEGSKKFEIELSYPYDQFLLDIEAKGDDKYENKIKKVIKKYLLKDLFKVKVGHNF